MLAGKIHQFCPENFKIIQKIVSSWENSTIFPPELTTSPKNCEFFGEA